MIAIKGVGEMVRVPGLGSAETRTLARALRLQKSWQAFS